ncbi:response regulator transcription factor BfmR [soil metagenome]
MYKILVVEDNKKLCQLICDYLIKQGFIVCAEARGDKAVYRILHENYDLIVLDINLPGLDGLQICKLIRKDYAGIILMLTAREADEDQITGLELGADDYVNKPINPNVLLARIQLLLRRKNTTSAMIKQLKYGKLLINLESRTVIFNDKVIDMTSMEFELFSLLAINAGTVLNRDIIMKSLRGIDYDGVDRSIDLRISYLRNKFPGNAVRIKTLRGKGYVFQIDAWE